MLRLPIANGSLRHSRLVIAVAVTLGFLTTAAYCVESKGDADALSAQAEALCRKRDLPGAQAAWEQALTIYRRLGLQSESAAALMALGQVRQDAMEYPDAEDAYQQALAVWQALRREKEAAATLHALARLLIAAAGKEDTILLAIEHEAPPLAVEAAPFERARSYGEQALLIWRRLKLKQQEADTLIAVGIAHQNLAQFDQAIDLYRRAWALSHGSKHLRGQAEALVQLASIARDRSDLDKPLYYYEESLRIARRLGAVGPEVVALQDADSLVQHLARYAITHYQQALVIWRKLDEEKEIAVALHGLGQAEFGRRQYKQAEGYYSTALAIRRRLGLKREEAATLHNLGRLMDEVAEYGKAVRYYEQALAIRHRCGLERDEARTLLQLGFTEGSLYHNDKALAYYDQAAMIFRKLGLQRDEALTLQARGLRAFMRGEIERYAEDTAKALDLWQKLNVPEQVAGCLENLGEAAKESGQYDRALDYCQQALAKWSGLGKRVEEAYTHCLLGGVLYRTGQFPEARKQLELSKVMLQGTGLPRDTPQPPGYGLPSGYEAETWMTLGLVAKDLGDYDSAYDSFRQALGKYQRLRLEEQMREVTGHLADAYLDEGRLTEARPLLERYRDDGIRWGRYYLLSGHLAEAEKEFERAGEASEGKSFSYRVAAKIGLGLAQEGLQRLEQAKASYTQAVDLIEQARSSAAAAERATFFVARDYGFRRLEPYEGLVRVLHRQGREEDAFQWSEHTKARVLLEMIARAPLALPAGLSTQEDGLVKQTAPGSGLAEESSEQVSARERQLESALAPRPLPPSDLALEPGEVLLAYEVTESESFAFLIRGGEVAKAFEIKRTRPELRKLIEDYRMPFASVGAKADLGLLKSGLTSGEKLYQLLVAPVLAEVRSEEHIVVIPDEAIGLLPLEALVVKGAADVVWREGEHGPYSEEVTYLGESQVFTYWQSATAMTALRELRARNLGERVLVLADPVFDTDDPRVQDYMAPQIPGEGGMRQRRSRICASLRSTFGDAVFQRLAKAGEIVDSLRLLYGAPLRPLVGTQASEEALKRESLDNYQVIVFATHAILASDVPLLRQPALVLSLVGDDPQEDGYLTMGEVMQLKLRAEVVALMACNTGAGRMVGGEGVMAMGRAFQYAGARSVLSSLWKAEDASTNLLTETFLKEMVAGKDKAAALQAARQRLREAGYVHPFYWANFVLIGEQTVATPQSGTRTPAAS